jgi:3',5'-cyclic AMP phosphodiesterase CpdA
VRDVLAQISDFHLRSDDDGPTGRLAATLDALLALERRPDAVLASGDLADGARPEEYAAVDAQLARLPMPVYRLPGNHDDFSAGFAERVGPLRLIGCDTRIPGADGGRLDVAWLEERLAEDAETPTIVAMHHPPVAIGMRAADEIAIAAADSAALAALLARSPQVKRIACGHVHRAVFAQLAGVPVVSCPSANSFARFADTFQTEDFAAGYLVHLLVDGEVVTHHEATL